MVIESILISGTFLILWFEYTLPVMVFRLLFGMGFKRQTVDWENGELGTWSRSRWTQWTWLHLKPETAYMLSCPGCLGLRFSIGLAFAALWLRPEPLADPEEIIRFLATTTCSSFLGGLFLLLLHSKLSSFPAPSAPEEEEASQEEEEAFQLPTLADHRTASEKVATVKEWRERTQLRAVLVENSKGEKIYRLGDLDSKVAGFFGAIEEGRDPCKNFPAKNCVSLASKIKKALTPVDGKPCPACDRGDITRAWWETVYLALTHNASTTAQSLERKAP